MRVRRIDQNPATPIDTFQCFMHVHPMDSENNGVALDRLLPGTCDGAGAEIGDEISQCLRTSGIGHNYSVTSVYQVMTERTSYIPGAYESYFHNLSPFIDG